MTAATSTPPTPAPPTIPGPKAAGWLAWILTAYAAGIGVGAVTVGRLIDLRGDRPVRITAVMLITVGTVLCVAAPTLPVLVAGRVVLAVGSGAAKATALTGTARDPRHQRAGVSSTGDLVRGESSSALLNSPNASTV